jgi:hypothetical protein
MVSLIRSRSRPASPGAYANAPPLSRLRLGFPLVPTALKELDQFALRTAVRFRLPCFPTAWPPCFTSPQDYRRSGFSPLRRLSLHGQPQAPEQELKRLVLRTALLFKNFLHPRWRLTAWGAVLRRCKMSGIPTRLLPLCRDGTVQQTG